MHYACITTVCHNQIKLAITVIRIKVWDLIWKLEFGIRDWNKWLRSPWTDSYRYQFQPMKTEYHTDKLGWAGPSSTTARLSWSEFKTSFKLFPWFCLNIAHNIKLESILALDNYALSFEIQQPFNVDLFSYCKLKVNSCGSEQIILM